MTLREHLGLMFLRWSHWLLKTKPKNYTLNADVGGIGVRVQK
jgi:hypothetical protein